jgi:site-specific recombinase XerD
VEEERLDLVHRSETGTQLKNKKEGERPVALSTELATMLGDYVENSRHAVTGENDRRPLLTSSHGRMHRTTLQGVVYRVTAPCFGAVS